jgi:cytochrome b561
MSIDENRLNQIRPDGRKYDPATIWLHWITVGLILPLWIIGQTADWFPQPARMPIWSVHVLLGFAIALILLTRIAWRANFGRSLPPVDIGLLNWVARLTHLALYFLIGAVVFLGILDASYRGFSIFGIWSIPQFGTDDPAIRRSITGWHGLAANALVAIAAVHAAAALVHQYVFRDRLLTRMRP